MSFATENLSNRFTPDKNTYTWRSAAWIAEGDEEGEEIGGEIRLGVSVNPNCGYEGRV